MRNDNCIVVLNRDIRRKVERYQRNHPKLTFTQAYNKLFNTHFDEPIPDMNTSVYYNQR